MEARMFANACFIIAMLALACCLFMAVGAVLTEGLRGIVTRKRPLYLAFSLYTVAFVLYLVTQ